MKKEDQILAKLENVITEINNFVEALPKEERDTELTYEHAAHMACLFGSLVAFAWVMDCEQEVANITQFMSAISKVKNLEATLANLNKGA